MADRTHPMWSGAKSVARSREHHASDATTQLCKLHLSLSLYSPPHATTSSSPPSIEKYKAALSAEERPIATSLPPGLPKKLATDNPHWQSTGRLKTPTTSKWGAQSPTPKVMSDIDVSRTDHGTTPGDYGTVDVSLDDQDERRGP